MDIVKGSGIVPEFKKVLIIGPEKTNKTGFIASMPGKKLVFCGESNTLTRLGGREDTDFVICYDQPGEPRFSGLNRFWKNFKELCGMKKFPYDTIAIDPINYLSDDILSATQAANPGLKTSAGWDRSIYGIILGEHKAIFQPIKGWDCYACVTSHVDMRKDDTTGRDMFMSSINGSIRENIGGYFHGVFHSMVRPVPGKPNEVEYYLQHLPDANRRCGVAVPVGCEGILGKEVPSDYAKIAKMVNDGFLKLKGGTSASGNTPSKAA